MKQPIQLFYWGLIISFLGSLPPGVMNVAAMQIAGKQGADAAFVYALGSMLAEVIIVRVALSGMSWLSRSRRFFQLLEWMTAALLVIFSIGCFAASGSLQDFSVLLPELVLPPFVTGVVLSVINPLHIPFWMGWSTVLMNRGLLLHGARRYNIYVTGIGTGTIAGFAVFIYGGQYLLKAFQSNQYLIYPAIGVTLFIVAFMHIRKIVIVPVSVRYAKMFR